MSDSGGNAPESAHILVAGGLYAPEEVPGPVAVVFEGTTIRAVWRDTDEAEARRRVNAEQPGQSVEIVDLGKLRLAPGYIDLHDHGFRNRDITTGTSEDVQVMAAELPRTGTTSFFPTIASTGRQETARQVRRCVQAAADQSGTEAEILGIRLEGPFISKIKKGAQYEPAIRPPDPDEMLRLADVGGGWVRIVDFAPEEDKGGRLLATLVESGILPSIGHTDASYAEAIRAIDGGARHCTHLFNAMPPLDHRASGTVGALLTDRRPTVEIIADGIHLSSAILKLVVEARGPRDVALVTDAVGPAGLPDGEYMTINHRVFVSGGAVRLENGTIAGSVLTMERAVRNMVTMAGLGWADAIRMATLTPARIAGLAGRKGAIVPGADADLLALDDTGCVQRVWTRGQSAYRADREG